VLYEESAGLAVIALDRLEKDYNRKAHILTDDKGPVKEVACVKMFTGSDDRPFIAAGGSGCVKVWDGETLELKRSADGGVCVGVRTNLTSDLFARHTLAGHRRLVWRMLPYYAGGSTPRLVCLSEEPVARVWCGETGRPVGGGVLGTRTAIKCSALFVSMSGEPRVVVGCTGGWVFIFDPEAASQATATLHKIRPHTRQVRNGAGTRILLVLATLSLFVPGRWGSWRCTTRAGWGGCWWRRGRSTRASRSSMPRPQSLSSRTPTWDSRQR
jgi:hypothetical protein